MKALRIVLTILALVGFALLARLLTGKGEAAPARDGAIFHYEQGVRETVTGLGLMLLGAWLTGKLAQLAKLSKITGYILFGIVIGPHFFAALNLDFAVIGKDELRYLKLANNLAIALIALSAGGEIDLRFVRQSLKMIGCIVGSQVVVVVGLVGGAMVAVFHFMPELGVAPGHAIAIAIVVAVIATASSPAVVIALVEEVRARGAFTQAVLTVTVCKDLILVVLFAIAMAVAGAMLGVDTGGEHSLAAHLVMHLGGSLAIGAVFGLALAAYVHFIGAHLALVLIGASFGLALIGARLNLEPLLAALAAGVLMRNVYPSQTAPLFETVRELSVPVYAVFFAVAGCKTDPVAFATVWPAVAALVIVRGLAVVLGTWAGAKVARVDAVTQRWGWTAFISQAGVSLALAYLLTHDFESVLRPEEGAAGPVPLEMVLISAIAIHELVGPILFKVGLGRSGDAGREDAGPEGVEPPSTEGKGPGVSSEGGSPAAGGAKAEA
ncbi:MAG: cation:proton antiporter [Phycisphaerales bacterium]|nr:cation:proton antiporter [Phycisphaerales bacterium]